jgi:hypothetical protein
MAYWTRVAALEQHVVSTIRFASAIHLEDGRD